MPRSRTSERHAEREILRIWLESLRESTSLSYEQLGRRAGLDPSNLTRFVKPGSKTGLGLETIRKLSKTFAVPAPVGMGFEPRRSGFSDRELTQWRDSEAPPADGNNGIDWWEVQTNLLELDGFFIGDKIEVDLNRTPRDGDVVVAQVEIDRGRDAQTILRRYERPYLVCRTVARDHPRPEIVDGRRVIIMGVVISLKRLMFQPAA